MSPRANRAAQLLFPPLPKRRWTTALTLALFAFGAAATLSPLHSVGGVGAPLTASAIATALYAAARVRSARPALRWPITVARAATVVVHVSFLYCAVGFGAVLGWATSPGLRLLVVALWLVAAFSLLFVPAARLPISVPLGVWVLACVLAWGREDGLVRCDDLQRLAEQEDVELWLASRSDSSTCAPGHVLPVHRYPRRVWEHPEGRFLLVTTSEGLSTGRPEEPPPTEVFTGSVCAVPLDHRGPPRCLGRGKAQGIAVSEEHERVFVTAWGDVGDGQRGVVYAIPTNGPFEVIHELYTPRPSVALYYEPEQDRLGVFFDDASGMLPVDAATLAPTGELVPAPFIPDDVLYDATRDEGVLCFSPSVLSPFDRGAAALVAFRARPFSPRALASSRDHPWAWGALVWGCAYDPDARRAHAAVANLGLLLTIDYDRGTLLSADFVEVGLRPMTVDAVRRRLYVANFIRGDLHALDLDTGEQVRTWFVGRFVRGVRLSRDGRALWVTSNLGVVRVWLASMDDP